MWDSAYVLYNYTIVLLWYDCMIIFIAEVRASQLAQASERVGSLIPASQQG